MGVITHHDVSLRAHGLNDRAPRIKTQQQDRCGLFLCVWNKLPSLPAHHTDTPKQENTPEPQQKHAEPAGAALAMPHPPLWELQSHLPSALE